MMTSKKKKDDSEVFNMDITEDKLHVPAARGSGWSVISSKRRRRGRSTMRK